MCSLLLLLCRCLLLTCTRLTLLCRALLIFSVTSNKEFGIPSSSTWKYSGNLWLYNYFQAKTELCAHVLSFRNNKLKSIFCKRLFLCCQESLSFLESSHCDALRPRSTKPGTVVYTCAPNYLGGWGRNIASSRPALTTGLQNELEVSVSNLVRCHFKIKIIRKAEDAVQW